MLISVDSSVNLGYATYDKRNQKILVHYPGGHKLSSDKWDIRKSERSRTCPSEILPSQHALIFGMLPLK
jgi:hypothetical protein